VGHQQSVHCYKSKDSIILCFFLSETHLDEENAADITKKLKMDHMIVAPRSDGCSRGLLMV
jgi:hypothetical protein